VTAWDGAGHHSAGLTLTDDEVLALAATVTVNTMLPHHLSAALRGYNKIAERAEELINEQRAGRR